MTPTDKTPAKTAFEALSGAAYFKANLPHVAHAPQSDQALSEALDEAAKGIDSDRKFPTLCGVTQALYGALLGQVGWMARLINGIGDQLRTPQGRFALVCAAADWASCDKAEALADVLEQDPDAREHLALLQRNLKEALEIVQRREDERAADAHWAGTQTAERAA